MTDDNNAPQELTIRVILFGILLAIVLSAANAYLGLFAGMTVSAAIPAAVIALGIMRFFRGSSIQECNLVGTCASAGESLAAGVIFTLPALLFLGFWQQFNYLWVAIIAGFGGLLGVLFTIPLRRSLIVEGDLKFPEGVATAKVLETGRRDASGIWYIVKAAVAGGLFKVGANAIGLWPEVMQGAARVRGTIAYCGSNLSPALLSVGYIVGLNIAVLIFIGGGMNWFVAIPVVAGSDEWPQYQLLNRNVPEDWDLASPTYVIVDPNDPEAWDAEADEPKTWNAFVLECQKADPNTTAEEIEEIRVNNADAVLAKLGEPVPALEYANRTWSKRTRFLGVGAMLLGGLWTIFHMRKNLLSGMTSGLKAYREMTHGQGQIDRTERDLPMKWIITLIVFSVAPLFLVYQHYVQQVHISMVMALVMLVTGFLFAAVAGYMAGLVGSSNNPISGVTISTVLIASLLLFLLMRMNGLTEAEAAVGPAAAVIIGAVVCCAAAIAGDVMQDLKCGRLVGTTPWKQQTMEMIGTVSAALIIGPVLMLLQNAYGFRGMEGAGEKALSSPQANLMASVARGVFQGDLPWAYLFIGMGVAALIIVLDLYLQARQYPFRTPVLAVAIGFYLPFQLSVPIFIGGLISLAVRRYHKARQSDAQEMEASDRRGLLMASGLITGEALMGILVAIPIVILKQVEIELPIIEHYTGAIMPFGGYVGVGLLLIVTFWLYVVTVRNKNTSN
ncbi:MAG: oligopeptide transporter, OPT family [Phycisphaerales bacterium]|nr:MAG: oligopeptide transporter, OPT family [Phycisphaerales bacterium]